MPARATGAQPGIAALNRSRQAVEVEKRAPSREITSPGNTMLPAVKRRIEAARQAEAHQRRGSGIDQLARGHRGRGAAHAADRQQRAVAQR